MGTLAFILHAHLPFVRHPEQSFFWEENWLFEAITGCYLPLLNTFNRLKAEGVPFHITMSLTPPLIYMLRDALLCSRYQAYLARALELAEKERCRTRYVASMHALAQHYQDRFRCCQHDFVHTYNGDLVDAFAALQQSGHIEILASCATHGFLPFLQINPASVRAQINVGIDVYRRHFGCSPRGFWLPECGYYPGLEAILGEAGVEYFILDTHGLTLAAPSPRFGPYQNRRCANGVAVFARDPESSHQVWSAQSGYPSAPLYREFHRDLGYEAEYDYIRPYIDPAGTRIPTGFKYRRITGATEHKETYDVVAAQATARRHARDFIARKQQQLTWLRAQGCALPIVVAPFDAELFGHWWYEGPLWLEYVLRGVAAERGEFTTGTLSAYVDRDASAPMVAPSASTWGHEGFGSYWLNPSNDWVYPRLHRAGARMAELSRRATRMLGRREVHDQAARELFLAEASDWAFMLRTGNVAPYARRRVNDHLDCFDRLYEAITCNTVDWTWFDDLRQRDTIFHDVACADYFVPRPSED